MSLKINIGCGKTPIKGWLNYDNSRSIFLANHTLLTMILERLGFLSYSQLQFISFAKKENILLANASKLIPEKNMSVDVIYSSHMLEHLNKKEAVCFLKEARRILKSGGIIRIAVPNIKYHIENYLKYGDADKFIESTLLTIKEPKGMIAKIKYLIIGHRHHQWMYDGKSLCKLLSLAGFQTPNIIPAGSTTIVEPGALNLKERLPESVFVEAINP